MDESNKNTCVRVKRKNVKTVFQNVDKIHELFSVRLCEKTAQKQDVSNTGGWVLLEMEIENAEENIPHSEIVSKVQVSVSHEISTVFDSLKMSKCLLIIE